MVRTAATTGRRGGVLAPADALNAGDGHQPGHLVTRPTWCPAWVIVCHIFRMPNTFRFLRCTSTTTLTSHASVGSASVTRLPAVGVVAARGDPL